MHEKWKTAESSGSMSPSWLPGFWGKIVWLPGRGMASVESVKTWSAPGRQQNRRVQRDGPRRDLSNALANFRWRPCADQVSQFGSYMYMVRPFIFFRLTIAIKTTSIFDAIHLVQFRSIQSQPVQGVLSSLLLPCLLLHALVSTYKAPHLWSTRVC